MNKKQLGVTLVLILLMIILFSGENIFNNNINRVALINKNIEGLNTYTTLDGVVTYKLPDSWDVEEKKYPGNYIIYDNNFTSEDMGIWGYVQLLNSEDGIERVIEKDKEKLKLDNISDYNVKDEKFEEELVKKITFKEKNENGALYMNTIYYKKVGESKIVKVLFNASEKDKKNDYSVIYKAIIDSLVEKN